MIDVPPSVADRALAKIAGETDQLKPGRAELVQGAVEQPDINLARPGFGRLAAGE